MTELQPLAPFYRAEDDHQHYYARNAGAPYCQYVVAPKLEKPRQKFARLISSVD